MPLLEDFETDASSGRTIITRYALAFPTSDQKASTVAKVLWEKVFVHYGLPERLHSDQRRDFDSQGIQELCKMLNIKT